jgi:N-acetylmuramoyl-L-alanine amidase
MKRGLSFLPLLVLLLLFVAPENRVSADPHKRASAGSLSGKRIFISPGHGWYLHSTLGWTTQRGNVNGIVEDFSNALLAIDYVMPYLVNAGAQVVCARERSFDTHEFFADNGDATYSSTGTWTNSTNVTGFYGTNYRWATTALTETAVSRWTIDIAAEGRYPVYVRYTAAGDRAVDAKFRVIHAGGTSTMNVDQTQQGGRWLYLGEWEFNAASDAIIELSNQSASAGQVVVADAVRVGGGTGQSGNPRYEEQSTYWAELVGAPSSVYNAGDVGCRPLHMEWWGGCDLYLSMHSNASGQTPPSSARGTTTYTYNNGGSTQHPQSLINQSVAFAQLINDQIVDDMRALHDPTWVDRGLNTANFGEVRPALSCPSALVETAFHDNIQDSAWLRNGKGKHTVGRAIYKAIARYFNASATILPLPPVNLRMQNTGSGQVTLNWAAQVDPLEASATPASYKVYLSSDGFAFDDGHISSGSTSDVISGLTPGQTVFAKVTALNAGGESLTSEVLCARTPDSQAGALATPLLIVSGYDRFDEFTYYQQGTGLSNGDLHVRNTFDTVRRHALSAAKATTSAGGTWAFDSSSNEAVINGSVTLGTYTAVDWVLGNESTADETFSSTEQSLVSTYRTGGGASFVSGGEIGWDLDRGSGPTTADRAFYNNVLKADYVSDSSNDWTVDGVTGSIFAGLAGVAFDNGNGFSYTVGYPDVLAVSGGSTACLQYSSGVIAGVQFTSPPLVNLGFPIETLNNSATRDDMFQRILRFLTPSYTGISGGAGVTVVTATLPNGTVGLGYSQTLQATGGTAPYTWDITAGALPGGITLSTAGDLSGMPTASGTFNFTVRARDTALVAGTRPLTLIVDPSGSPGGPVIVTTSALPNGMIGQAYSQGLSASGGQPPYTWAITFGTLPSGLTLSTNGVISGTPTSAVIASFTVRATDSAASPQQGSAALSLTVDTSTSGLVVLSTSLADGTKDSTYSETLYAANGTPPYTWDITAGLLPGGLTLNPATGVVSGSPTQRGTFSFNVTVTDSTSTAATTGLTLTINKPPKSIDGELSCGAREGSGSLWVLMLLLVLLRLRWRLHVHGNR